MEGRFEAQFLFITRCSVSRDKFFDAVRKRLGEGLSDDAVSRCIGTYVDRRFTVGFSDYVGAADLYLALHTRGFEHRTYYIEFFPKQVVIQSLG